MKKFFIKVWCLVVNSLVTTLTFLFSVIWYSFWTVIMFMTAICSGESWNSLKLKLITMWTMAVEAITEGITMIQEYDKEHYGI